MSEPTHDELTLALIRGTLAIGRDGRTVATDEEPPPDTCQHRTAGRHQRACEHDQGGVCWHGDSETGQAYPDNCPELRPARPRLCGPELRMRHRPQQVPRPEFALTDHGQQRREWSEEHVPTTFAAACANPEPSPPPPPDPMRHIDWQRLREQQHRQEMEEMARWPESLRRLARPIMSTVSGKLTEHGVVAPLSRIRLDDIPRGYELMVTWWIREDKLALCVPLERIAMSMERVEALLMRELSEGIRRAMVEYLVPSRDIVGG